jgi:homoserine kinase type II
MAQYTVLNDTDLQTILTHYSVGKVWSYKILSGGSENTNYFIKTEHNAYVLTICEQKSPKEAKDLALLLDYLALNNFATSKLIRTLKDKLTVTFNNKPVILKAFIEGDIVQDLSENLLLYLGKELAKLHQVKVPNYVPKTLNYGSVNRFDEVQIYAPDSAFYKWLKDTQHYIENYIHSELPKALIHSDIFYSNIIVSKDRNSVTIMDFEEACYYYRVFDIGMTIVGTCRSGDTINLDKVRHLLSGYQQHTKLLKLEEKALKAFTVYAAAGTAFWRHQHFNYINIIAEKKEHYLEMQSLADTIMNLSDNDWV